MANKTKIVLAWVVQDFVVEKEGRVDLGERHKLREILVPKAAMWLNKGSSDDVAKAQEYADRETDYKIAVFTYPTNEKNPIERAKKDVLKLVPKK